jgi:hypothetical protein
MPTRHVHGQTLPNNKHLLNCSPPNVPTKSASWTALSVMCEISGYDSYDCKDCSLTDRDAVTLGANMRVPSSESMMYKARCSAMVLPLHKTARRHCPLERSNGQRCSADRESDIVTWVTRRSTWQWIWRSSLIQRHGFGLGLASFRLSRYLQLR